MLLGNDVVEGREAQQLEEADRVYLLLKGHMRRLRDQLACRAGPAAPRWNASRSPPSFQAELAAVWERYLAIQQALAADSFDDARQALTGLQSAATTVDAASLSGQARQMWDRERANLDKVIDALQRSQDITAMRS